MGVFTVFMFVISKLMILTAVLVFLFVILCFVAGFMIGHMILQRKNEDSLYKQ